MFFNTENIVYQYEIKKFTEHSVQSTITMIITPAWSFTTSGMIENLLLLLEIHQ